MGLRVKVFAISLVVFLWAGAANAQEQELLRSQAGRYSVRVALSKPATVGPAHLIVELGPPTASSATPRLRPIRIGSPAGSPYASPTPTAPAKPNARDFAGVEVAVTIDMPEMPATKAVDIELTSTALGRYEGDALLTMAGKWRLTFLISTPDGITRKPLTVPVGNLTSTGRAESGREGLELCSPGSGEDVPVTVHCVPDPPRVGDNLLRIDLPEAAAVPIAVGLDMPGMALAIPPIEAERQDDGHYEATVHLPMAGYWQLRVDLNGRTLPPFALNVNEPEPARSGRTLLLLTLGVLVPCLGWVATKRPRILRPVLVCGGIALLVLGVAVWLEGPGSSTRGMTMEMVAADLGLSHLSAPLPVLETRVQTSPFVVSKSYPGRVVPATETVLASPLAGPVTSLVSAGAAVEAGQTLARIGQASVPAPCPGVVARVMSPTGAQVGPGSPLLVLVDMRKLTLRARAPLSDRGLVKTGMKVVVADAEKQPTSGIISSISSLSQAGTFDFEATVAGRKRQPAVIGHDGAALSPAGERNSFFLGQEVVVQVEIDRLPASAAVPKGAVRRTSDGETYVFLVERVAGHRVARRTKVTLGAANDTQVQVLSGLLSGQTIVASAESSLRDGDIVVPATLGEGVYRSLYVPGQAPSH